MDVKALAFPTFWISLTALFAWISFNRLGAAQQSGRFEYVFHGMSEGAWPLLFKVCKAFLTLQAWGFSFMAGVGLIWLVWVLLEKLK